MTVGACFRRGAEVLCRRGAATRSRANGFMADLIQVASSARRNRDGRSVTATARPLKERSFQCQLCVHSDPSQLNPT
jgi:hypothetical protein